jgi:hypothetical protein
MLLVSDGNDQPFLPLRFILDDIQKRIKKNLLKLVNSDLLRRRSLFAKFPKTPEDSNDLYGLLMMT